MQEIFTPAERTARARSLCNEAYLMAALQRRRLRSSEPEDDTFIMRVWADWQLFITAVNRVRNTADLVGEHPAVSSAVNQFDAEFDDLRTMRNVGEHIGEYGRDIGRDKSVGQKELQVGTFNENELVWLGKRIVADDLLKAAYALVTAIRNTGTGSHTT